MPEPDPDLDSDRCSELYKCETCGYRTVQSRRCMRCGGDVYCPEGSDS